jgi:CheY-like chemotaxis protein
MAKIMVVDDEILLRSMIKDALEEAGHTVVLAENGLAAVDRAKGDHPDCILMDIMMPDLDGYDACAIIKADPGLAAIPVFLVSATTDLRVVDRAEQVGAAGVLPKPVPVEQLLQTVALALNPPSP